MDGTPTPSIGFGTYPQTGETCTHSVKLAIKTGYLLLDTATYYKNFAAIAKALKGHDRRHFYISSKVWHDKQSSDDVHKDLERTLKELQTDYIDAYFVHWPNSEIPIEETLGAMEELRHQKKIRHIGLSNVNVNHMKRALELNIPITWVQIEMSPFFYDPALLKFCKDHSIHVQAWAPLGRGRVNDDPLLANLSKKYKKTPSQIAIKWILQHGCMPLPGSTSEKHMQENLGVEDFTLTKEEMKEIDQRAKDGERKRCIKERIGFNDEFDFSYDECWPIRQKNRSLA